MQGLKSSSAIETVHSNVLKPHNKKQQRALLHDTSSQLRGCCFCCSESIFFKHTAPLSSSSSSSSSSSPSSPLLCFWSHRDSEPLHSCHSSRSEQSALSYLLVRLAAPLRSVCCLLPVSAHTCARRKGAPHTCGRLFWTISADHWFEIRRHRSLCDETKKLVSLAFYLNRFIWTFSVGLCVDGVHSGWSYLLNRLHLSPVLIHEPHTDPSIYKTVSFMQEL